MKALIFCFAILFLCFFSHSFSRYDYRADQMDQREDEMEEARRREEKEEREFFLCSGDNYNCEDLQNPRDTYKTCMRVVGYDVHNLDLDMDGIPCEAQMLGFSDRLLGLFNVILKSILSGYIILVFILVAIFGSIFYGVVIFLSSSIGFDLERRTSHYLPNIEIYYFGFLSSAYIIYITYSSMHTYIVLPIITIFFMGWLFYLAYMKFSYKKPEKEFEEFQ